VPSFIVSFLNKRSSQYRTTDTTAAAALAETAKDLGASTTITNLSVALYMLSISFFPLWWSAFSETAGRRTTYISSLILFILFAILSSVARSISVFVAMRMLSGGAGASVQAVGAGTLADIWEPRERGKAMGRFYIGPLCGPLLAPIIGGLVS
jgi:MFS family permease